jgi:hypothetical protein
MYDAGKILAGLAVFLIVLTFPFWYDGFISAKPEVKPDPKIVTTEKQCVEPRAFMRDAHMTLLNQWRDDVVRREQRDFVSPDGRHFQKSLTGTCLKCHSNKAEFCDRCHTFMAVSTPYCFECHVDPEDKKVAASSSVPHPAHPAGKNLAAMREAIR